MSTRQYMALFKRMHADTDANTNPRTHICTNTHGREDDGGDVHNENTDAKEGNARDVKDKCRRK